MHREEGKDGKVETSCIESCERVLLHQALNPFLDAGVCIYGGRWCATAMQ